jgi:hypothetical protein
MPIANLEDTKRSVIVKQKQENRIHTHLKCE